MEEGKTRTLIPVEKYLTSGAHIGTKFKSCGMRKYIYKRREDGLMVMDINTLDERIGTAAKFISAFKKEKVVVVSRKLYGKTPIRQFAEATGAVPLNGRFVPGTFTNPEGKEFIEPNVLVVTDPESDKQAIEEATKLRVPIIAFCSTNNSTRNIDLVIPINNKGRKSLALGYWLLAREVLKERKEIKSNEEFKKKIEDFEYQLKELEDESIEERREHYKRKMDRDRKGWRGRREKEGGMQRRSTEKSASPRKEKTGKKRK